MARALIYSSAVPKVPETAAHILHSDGTVRDPELPVATGHAVRFTMPDDTLHRVTIVVKGDVHNTGMHGLHQIIGMAKAYAGQLPLGRLESIAADLDENGRIDLSDIINATKMYIKSRP